MSIRSEHYHQASDEVAHINFDALRRFTELKAAIARDAADIPERPRWKSGDFFGTNFDGPIEGGEQHFRLPPPSSRVRCNTKYCCANPGPPSISHLPSIDPVLATHRCALRRTREDGFSFPAPTPLTAPRSLLATPSSRLPELCYLPANSWESGVKS